MAEHNEIGQIGEKLTKEFLMKQGFEVLEQNYRVRQGELDIVAKKDGILHFVEVKSIKVRDCNNIEGLAIRPEDNFTFQKWLKTKKAFQIYMFEKGISPEFPHQVDLACVYIDLEKREGRIRIIQNVYHD